MAHSLPWYLTNIKKADGLAERVAKASELSGQDVRYQSGPMPLDPSSSYDYWIYSDLLKSGALDDLDCIVGYSYGDHDGAEVGFGPFWREYEKLVKD